MKGIFLAALYFLATYVNHIKNLAFFSQILVFFPKKLTEFETKNSKLSQHSKTSHEEKEPMFSGYQQEQINQKIQKNVECDSPADHLNKSK
jgi:hypothetical protein